MPNPFLYIQTVLFQTNNLSISTQFRSVWLEDRTQSGATTPGQSGPGSDGNESSRLTGVSPSECLVSYPGHSIRGVLPVCSEILHGRISVIF